ncbi:MAG: hypothetical protein U0800_18405 [Isosphaeraceae bacterium]
MNNPRPRFVGTTLLLAAALMARVAYLETIPGVSGDEAWYGVQMGRVQAGQSYETRTPTGLPLNPFYAWWEAPLLMVANPAPWILRAPAVVSSILAIVVASRLLRSPLGSFEAMLITLSLAVLPVALDFSRIGWDQSQAALFGILAFAFALRAQPIALLLSFYAFLWVHPANVFALPAASATFLAAAWTRWPKRRMWVLAGTIAGTLLMVGMARNGNTQPRFLAEPDAWFSPGRWFENLILMGRIVSGESFIECHVGPIEPGARLIRATSTAAFLAILCLVGVSKLGRERSWIRLSLVLGTLASVLGVILAVDPSALAPKTERYTVGLTAPIAVSIGCLIAAVLPKAEPFRGWALAGFWAFAWIPLADFSVNFLGRTLRTGGDSHAAFWAGPIEPKQAAVRRILSDLPEIPPVARSGVDPRHLVVTEDWWTTMPVMFFKQGPTDRLRLLEAPANDEDRLRDCRKFLNMGAYLIGYSDGPLSRTMDENFRPDQIVRWETPRYGGRPGVIIYRRISGDSAGDD